MSFTETQIRWGRRKSFHNKKMETKCVRKRERERQKREQKAREREGMLSEVKKTEDYVITTNHHNETHGLGGKRN